MFMTNSLNAAKIYGHMSGMAREHMAQQNVQVFAELPSTQTYLSDSDSVVNALVVAESQTEGRGRLERSWHSSSAKNIMFSCSWLYRQAPAQLPALSLALIVVVAEYLQDDYDLPVAIKWPNDLLLNGQKIAGLLLNVETGKACCIVAGFGLNVRQSLENNRIDQPWTDLHQQGVTGLDRNKMIADIVSRWIQVFIDFEQYGFTEFQERWNCLAHFQGELVCAKKHSGKSTDELKGVLQGVDEQGLLVLNDNGKQIKISDSSYSLRRVV